MSEERSVEGELLPSLRALSKFTLEEEDGIWEKNEMIRLGKARTPSILET